MRQKGQNENTSFLEAKSRRFSNGLSDEAHLEIPSELDGVFVDQENASSGLPPVLREPPLPTTGTPASVPDTGSLSLVPQLSNMVIPTLAAGNNLDGSDLQRRVEQAIGPTNKAPPAIDQAYLPTLLHNITVPTLGHDNDLSAIPIFRLDQVSGAPDATITDLQAELRAAQEQLRTQLDDLRAAAGGDSLVSQCEAQLTQLYALEAGLQGTSAGSAADQRAQISAAIVSSRRISEAARAAVSDISGGSASLASITAATRDTVSSLGRDLFERRIFDPYLHFASAEDEAAYRQREADARRYIDEQMAKKTPQGDLNAAGATVDRMLDAEAHGAGDSPEFRERWNRLVTTTRRQREAVASAGLSTEEFDRNLATSVRQFLRSKGLSDAEIDARLQAARDPLAAVEPYLKTAEDAKALDVAVQSSTARETTSTVTVLATPGSPIQAASTSNNDMTVDDVMSTFRAAGVTTTVADTASGHGVGNRSAANTPGGRSGPT